MEKENGYEYVDLGLSVKWATFNVGATKPYEYGDHFAWGETEKYNNNSIRNYVDTNSIITLDLKNDVAHVKWGGNWRMPTREEMEELNNNCNWELYEEDNSEFNGVVGYKVTSNLKGYTNRFIFLPAAGYRLGDGKCDVGNHGYYWTSSPNKDFPSSAWSFYYNIRDIFHFTHPKYEHYLGQSIRPVCPSEAWSWSGISVALNKESASLQIGQTLNLYLSIKKGEDIVFYPITWTSNNPSIASVNSDGHVIANAAGNAVITGTFHGVSACCNIVVE